MTRPFCSNDTASFLCRATFQGSSVAQAVLDQESRIVDVNEQFCKLLGESKEALVRKPLQKFAVPEQESGLPLKVPVERSYLRKDGSIVHTVVTANTIQGNPTMRVIQVQCVNALKELEAHLQRNTEDLEQFAYITSHDLREPVTAMAGFATLLKRRIYNDIGKDEQHFLDEIISSTEHMAQKIEDLLTFSRAGRVDLKKTFPLRLAIDEAKKALVRHISESGVVFHISPDLPIIQGDRSMVAQVFQNLFSNSIKYRGGSPEITVTAKPYNDQQWLISVRDNGIGFDMRHANRIFGVFTRLYTPEQYPGTGIGLAIAKRVIERHWGKIWADSTPDLGTTFHFTLPAPHESLPYPPG